MGLGRSVTKRSVHCGSRRSWWDKEDCKYFGKYGDEYLPKTRRNNLRRQVHEAINEIYEAEMEAEFEEGCLLHSFEDLKEEMEELEELEEWAAKWEDLEVASVCTSTTAGGSEFASGFADFAMSVSAASSPSRSSGPSLSPWLAALRRAELRAQEYADAMEFKLATNSGPNLMRKTSRPRRTPRTDARSEEEQFLQDLGRTHRVRIEYDPASLTEKASAFDQLRWQFLKDFGESICGPLVDGYKTAWTLRPAPLHTEVQNKFLRAFSCRAEKRELQPALHGTDERNLSSIYRRGLLIPGGIGGSGGNDVRVANGSAHGLGIYTAYAGSACVSFGYSRGNLRPMLVCGVLDPEQGRCQTYGGAVKKKDICYAPGVRIFYKEELVAPLFEATVSAAAVPGAVRIQPPRPRKYKPSLVPLSRVLETAKTFKSPNKSMGSVHPGPRTRLPRPRTRAAPACRAQAFLARRAARKRQ